MKKMDNIIPEFKSEDEEREFWATHSALASRYMPEQKKIMLAAHADGSGARTCPYPRDTQKL